MPKVILVDDEDGFRAPLATRLRKRGFEVVEVDNGEDAVKLVRKDLTIDVAVIDLKMPKMDGIQTLEEIKVFRPALQTIMLTGHGSLDSAKDAGRLEAFKYRQKPCDLEELVGALEEARQVVDRQPQLTAAFHHPGIDPLGSHTAEPHTDITDPLGQYPEERNGITTGCA